MQCGRPPQAGWTDRQKSRRNCRILDEGRSCEFITTCNGDLDRYAAGLYFRSILKWIWLTPSQDKDSMKHYSTEAEATTRTPQYQESDHTFCLWGKRQPQRQRQWAKAYRKLAKDYHTDDGGDAAKFQAASSTACMRCITFYRIHYPEADWKNTWNTQACRPVHSCFDTLANQIHTRVHKKNSPEFPEFNWFCIQYFYKM